MHTRCPFELKNWEHSVHKTLDQTRTSPFARRPTASNIWTIKNDDFGHSPLTIAGKGG